MGNEEEKNEDRRLEAMDGLIDSLRHVHADRIRVDVEALAQTLGGNAP